MTAKVRFPLPQVAVTTWFMNLKEFILNLVYLRKLSKLLDFCELSVDAASHYQYKHFLCFDSFCFVQLSLIMHLVVISTSFVHSPLTFVSIVNFNVLCASEIPELLQL